MDLSNSVVLPQETYSELSTAAYTQPTLKDRAGQTAQSTLLFFALAGAVTAGAIGWAKVQDWREERSFQRRHAAELKDQEIAN